MSSYYEITKYFEWEAGPAVIAQPHGADYVNGFYIKYDDEFNTWQSADGPQIADFYIDGNRLSQSEFEAKFGIIGQDLPDLPHEMTPEEQDEVLKELGIEPLPSDHPIYSEPSSITISMPLKTDEEDND